MNRKLFYLLKIIFSVFLVVNLAGCKSDYIIDNPYENVDWANFGRYKADLHAHTSRSDGYFSPHVVVDLYHNQGYHIFAIADHNEVTYPWQEFSDMEPSELTYRRIDQGVIDEIPVEDVVVYENRDPAALGMVAIQANEISQNHHLGAYFSSHEDSERLAKTVAESLENIAGDDGLGVLFHPGRHGAEDNTPIEWYYDLFQKYDHLIGVEAYNSGLLIHQPGSINKWDSLLKYFMPDRTVWGFSNDDFHHFGMSILGRNFNVFLLPELSVEEVRSAMEKGSFYFVARHDGYYNGPPPTDPPVINSIDVDSRKGTISIEATNYEYIEWVSDGTVIYTGETIVLPEHPDIGSYVRANVYKEEDGPIAGTQPFGIRRSTE